MKAFFIKTAMAVILSALALGGGLAQQTLTPGVSRDVTPKGMTPAPRITAPLKRIPGVEPPPPEIRERNLYRIKVVDTATFEGRYLNRTWRVQLPGVVGVTRDETCKSDAGEWPCGGFILRALQRHIRLTALNCAFAWQPSDQPLEISCDLRGEDLAELVVARGWARLGETASDTLKNLAEAAERKSVGIHQPPPPGWQNYQALTRQGSSSDLPPPPDLPIADITGPLRPDDTDGPEAEPQNSGADQSSGEGFINQP